MTCYNFPDNPAINETYTIDNTTWIWNGGVWELVPFIIQGVQGTQGPFGIQGTQGLFGPQGVQGSIGSQGSY